MYKRTLPIVAALLALTSTAVAEDATAYLRIHNIGSTTLTVTVADRNDSYNVVVSSRDVPTSPIYETGVSVVMDATHKCSVHVTWVDNTATPPTTGQSDETDACSDQFLIYVPWR
jgi:hypothetical protein